MSLMTRLGLGLGVAARLSSRMRRPYGSAAAAQLDYDYYNYNYGEEKEEPTLVDASEQGWETPGRGVQWVIMGDRRHLYAERLAKLLDVPHISMGSLVRQELHPNSPLYKKIASSMNQGKLVPEDVIFGLLSKRLEEGYCRGENGFILDGIPRSRMQAEILDEIADIDLVLNLKCAGEEAVVKKTLGSTSSIYSPCREFHSMASSGLNLTLGTPKLQSSNADSEPIWKEKLRMFAEQRKPLEEYYEQQKKLLDFQVAGAPGDTWQCLLAALQLQHMNNNASAAATPSSQKLTA